MPSTMPPSCSWNGFGLVQTPSIPEPCRAPCPALRQPGGGPPSAGEGQTLNCPPILCFVRFLRRAPFCSTPGLGKSGGSPSSVTAFAFLAPQAVGAVGKWESLRFGISTFPRPRHFHSLEGGKVTLPSAPLGVKHWWPQSGVMAVLVRQLRGPHLSRCPWWSNRSSMAPTAAASPSSLPQSSTGRLEVSSVLARS